MSRIRIVMLVLVFVCWGIGLDGGADAARAQEDPGELGYLDFSGPVWSPDGEQIGFKATFPRLYTNIMVADLATGEFIKVTSADSVDLNPTWSPGGGYLAFDSGEGAGPRDVYVWSRFDGELRNVTGSLAPDDRIVYRVPDWSPDGTRLAVATESRTRVDIAIVNLVTQDVTILTEDFNIVFNRPYWSPDGEHIAITSFSIDEQYGIWLYSLAAMQISQLTDLPAIDLVWSPTGNAITFGTAGQPSPLQNVSLDGTVTPFNDIWTSLNPDGISNIVWSHSGERFAVRIRNAIGHDIYIFDADGANRYNLTNSPQLTKLDMAWSPDDSQLAFTAYPPYGNADVYVINADGTGLRNLTEPVREDRP